MKHRLNILLGIANIYQVLFFTMIDNELILYSDGELQLEGFSAYRVNERRPLVLLCHAWRGRDEFICDKANLVAALGYVGFAIDMYGKGILGNSQDENARLKKPFLEDRAFLRSRLLKGYNAACSLPYVDNTRIAVVGFGFGGICALDLARTGMPLKGAVSVYGHFEPPNNYVAHPIKAKVLLLHGYNDPISPLSTLLAFQQELDETQVEWQSHLYGNTFHAFATPSANDLSTGLMYNPPAAQHAWREIETFLTTIFHV